ncbi:peritrophin-1-like [Hyposmocoma kahamanoa]|uniref:peritrophin-1-like n=1 Tax=Hyposmocoma kahamanoa TaxID=1477025 RepID=UPI000E6D9E4D|nr:peritrophin-1-like [Hyposmocoma kahamanoa]
MIVKLLILLPLVVTIQARHQEDDYSGPFLPNGCPTDFEVHWLLRHDTECSKFYYCNFGERVERDCSDGTVFNYWANPGPVCDWPRNVDCDALYPPPTEDSPAPTDGTTTSPDTCPPTGTCPPPPDCDHDCESDCVKPWPHATDCDKLWICKDGVATVVTCSEGLHFNAETGTCDFICNAGCVRRHPQTTSHWHGVQFFMPWEAVDEELRNTHHIRDESTTKKINSLLRR